MSQWTFFDYYWFQQQTSDLVFCLYLGILCKVESHYRDTTRQEKIYHTTVVFFFFFFLLSYLKLWFVIFWPVFMGICSIHFTEKPVSRNMNLSAATERLVLQQGDARETARDTDIYMDQAQPWTKWMDWEKIGWTTQLCSNGKIQGKNLQCKSHTMNRNSSEMIGLITVLICCPLHHPLLCNRLAFEVWGFFLIFFSHGNSFSHFAMKAMEI